MPYGDDYNQDDNPNQQPVQYPGNQQPQQGQPPAQVTTQNTTQPQTIDYGGNAGLRNQISGWYQQYMGRTPSDQEITAWATGPYANNPSQLENYLKTSQEAQAYAQRNQGGGGPSGGDSNFNVGTGGGTGSGGAPPQGGSGPDTLTWLLNHGYAPQAAIDWIHSHPGYQGGEAAYYPNFKGGGSNVIGMNGGYLNQDADGSWHWVVRQEGGGGGAGGGGVGMDNPSAKALFDYLMETIKGKPGAAAGTYGINIDANDPIIRGQVDAARAQADRTSRDTLAQEAEAAGPYANLRPQEALISEREGGQLASLQSGLMSQELDKRRQVVQSALSGAMGLLTAEQQMSLQEELHQLDLAQRAFEFDTNQEYLNSPLNG